MSDENQHAPPDSAADDHAAQMIEAPPETILGILKRLGPGLIVAGSIVGSGELIATTLTGAEAGFWLLWLIIIGCVIKVFVQVELGRYTISTGNTTMDGFNEVPGPRWGRRGNWLVWYWFAMFLASIGQLGGIVGGVGQALAISVPLTTQGREFNEAVDLETKYTVALSERNLARQRAAEGSSDAKARVQELDKTIASLGKQFIDLRTGEAAQQRAAVAKRAEGDESAQAALAKMDQQTQLVLQRVKEYGNRPHLVFHLTAEEEKLPKEQRQMIAGLAESFGRRSGYDDQIWAAIITVTTAVILFMGRYGFIQTFSTILVGGFTLFTIANLALLQQNKTWAITGKEVVDGLSFRLPPMASADGGGWSLLSNPGLATALAAFGIIGVGASELVSYPYWCMAKGYARFTGPNDSSPQWAHRAQGWMRVMRWDAWCSMFVYTFATVAFYLLGAAILGRIGLAPEGTEMIRTLGVMYEPVFGYAAQVLFLVGAFAVLYSTFFVANASHARVLPDALRVMKLVPDDPATYERWVRILSTVFPFFCLLFYVGLKTPVLLVKFSGLMQAVMLPMIAAAGLYFRYRRSDTRLKPGKVWDAFLWVSAAGLLVAGSWAGVTVSSDLFARLFGG